MHCLTQMVEVGLSFGYAGWYSLMSRAVTFFKLMIEFIMHLENSCRLSEWLFLSYQLLNCCSTVSFLNIENYYEGVLLFCPFPAFYDSKINWHCSCNFLCNRIVFKVLMRSIFLCVCFNFWHMFSALYISLVYYSWN